MLSDEKLNDAYEAAVMRGVSHADGLRGVAMAVVRAERDGAKKSYDIRCPACNGKGYGGDEDGCSNCSDTGFVTTSLFIYNPEVGAEFWMAKAYQYDCERQELSAQLAAVRAELEGAVPVAWCTRGFADTFEYAGSLEEAQRNRACYEQWCDSPDMSVPLQQQPEPLYLHPPQASAMLALTDAMRAVIRNENDIYGTEDELYAALCDAAGKKASATVPEGLLSADEMGWLRRFAETTEDEGSYDIPHNAVRRLCDIGALSWRGHHRYQITDFGDFVLSATRHETQT